LPVQDVYSITGIGTVPVGRVETGVMKPGDKVVFMPAKVSGEVKSIEMHHEAIPQAEPGDNVGFNVRGINKNDVKRGDVVGHESNPPTVVKSFTAQIMVLNHPTVITAGYTPVFHCHTAQVACTITEIQKLLDPKTGQPIMEKEGQVQGGNVQFIKTGDGAIVKVKPTKPMVIERAKDFPPLGRFAVRDMGQTVAAGVVIDVEKA
jgi:elongation factor 1-alpha